MSKEISLIPGWAVDFGRVRTVGAAKSVSLTGWDLTALIRYGF